VIPRSRTRCTLDNQTYSNRNQLILSDFSYRVWYGNLSCFLMNIRLTRARSDACVVGMEMRLKSRGERGRARERRFVPESRFRRGTTEDYISGEERLISFQP
jgi:hypothetical protein